MISSRLPSQRAVSQQPLPSQVVVDRVLLARLRTLHSLVRRPACSVFFECGGPLDHCAVFAAQSTTRYWVDSCRPAMHKWKRSLLPEWITLVSEVSLGIGRGGHRYKHRHRLGHINIHTHIHKLVHRPLHIQHELMYSATAVSTDPCVDTTTGNCQCFSWGMLSCGTVWHGMRAIGERLGMMCARVMVDGHGSCYLVASCMYGF